MAFKLPPLMRKYLPGLLLLAATLLITGLVVNRFRLPGQSNMLESMAMDMNSMKPAPGSVPVGTAPVVMRRVQSELSYSGTVRGLNEISIAARVDGTLTSVPVYTGSRVARGQLLAQLSAPELGAQTQTAESERLQAQAELAVSAQEALRLKAEEQAAAAGIAQEQATLSAAQANQTYWQERLPRERELYEAGGIALEEYQRYQADAKVAEAEVAAAHQRVKAASQTRRARAAMLGENAARQRFQRAGIARAGAGVREKQVMQSFTRIIAPVGGIITERLQAPGAVIGAGTPILTLAQIDPVRVQIKVPEADLAGLTIGGMLTLVSAARPNDEIEASISSIAPASGAGSRTHVVEAIVPNPEAALLPGQYIKARLRSGASKAPQPALPERAIIQLQGQDSVWINQSGHAHLITVNVITRSGDWAVVEDLAKGTEVITDGYENLTEGMAVTPVRWTENGPEQLPAAGGAHRLNQANHWTLQADLGEGLRLEVSLSPKPPTSTNTLSIELRRAGAPVTDAKISLGSSMPAMNMPGPDIGVGHKGKGRYEAPFSGMGGLWQVVAVIETGGKRIKPFAFEFSLP